MNKPIRSQAAREIAVTAFIAGFLSAGFLGLAVWFHQLPGWPGDLFAFCSIGLIAVVIMQSVSKMQYITEVRRFGIIT